MPTPIMPTLVWQQLSDSERLAALARPAQSPENNIAAIVADIGKQVQADSDKALYQFAKQFDQVDLDNLTVEQSVLQAAADSLDDKLKTAIKQAFTNIHNFHLAQQSPPVDVAIQAGIRCQVLTRPIERVGLYIPGGSAPLFSTVLMLAIPAKIAACKHIVLCSPAPIHPAILYTAHLCGVDKVYAVGGAGAIFAMAYGTDSIPKVDKIFGPGNAFVTEAKRQVMMAGTAIDMPAGPSEVLVIADEFANADFVASDLLSQAEHGADSQVVLITPSKAFADKVDKALKQQLERLPRANTARLALAHSCALIASDIDEAVHISNLYAPEHLIIQTQKPRQLLDAIYHAGSVFLGAYSPESMGDYASGTNHVLPTYGYARTHSSLGLADFSKRMTVQELSEQGFVSLAETVAVMAEAEQLIAHKQAVSIRLQQLGV